MRSIIIVIIKVIIITIINFFLMQGKGNLKSEKLLNLNLISRLRNDFRIIVNDLCFTGLVK